MRLIQIAAFQILCLVLVVADPRRITRHYDFPDTYVYLSSVKKTSILYVPCNLTAYYDESYKGERLRCNATLESYNGSGKKLSCPFTIPPVYVAETRVFQVGKEHVLAAWLKGGNIEMVNIHLRDCKLTSSTLQAPPKDNFGIHYISVVPNETTYNVVVYGCIEHYRKACKNIYELDGTSVKKLEPLSKIDDFQTFCDNEYKHDNPANSFVAVCGNMTTRIDYLVKEDGVKVLKEWPPLRQSFTAYGDHIVLCSLTDIKSSDKPMNCYIFDSEGTLKRKIILDQGPQWRVFKLHVLPDGFLMTYMVEFTNRQQEPRIPDNERIIKTYVRRYDFEGRVVKELLVDDVIRKHSVNDIFQNEAGETCISLFGNRYPGFMTSFEYVAQCYEDL